MDKFITLIFLTGLVVYGYFWIKKKSSKSKARNINRASQIFPPQQTEKRDIPKPSKYERFTFAIYEKGESIDDNIWYQRESARNKSYVNYSGTYDGDWKTIASDIPVAGISKFDRTAAFVNLAQQPDFKMFLEPDPDNPVNKNAIKIMMSATVGNFPQKDQLGYLPNDIANKLAGKDIDVRPQSAFLPPRDDLSLGVKVKILGRSAKYLKKHGLTQ